ncbi:putative acid methyltransferase [Ixodes scapularis]
MVDYARRNHAHSRIRYEVLDITTPDVTLFLDNHGKFNRIYSFCCLNWIRDQEAAFRNIGRLLTDDGECLLLFTAPFFLYDVWLEMAKMERWKDIIGVYLQEQQDLARQLEDQDVDITSDGRFDSPGFSAKFLTYTAHDQQINKILHSIQVQLGEPAISSSKPVKCPGQYKVNSFVPQSRHESQQNALGITKSTHSSHSLVMKASKMLRPVQIPLIPPAVWS